jgi:hypothetical protein
LAVALPIPLPAPVTMMVFCMELPLSRNLLCEPAASLARPVVLVYAIKFQAGDQT